MMFYDPTFIILIPAIILSLWAQVKVSSTFNRYQEVKSKRGFTGAQIARAILNSNGLNDVKVEMIEGKLSDHYDPRTKVVRLSQDVYSGDSISSIGVAAHETGHAIQHEKSYAPLLLRNALVPLANFGSSAAWVLVLIGFFIGGIGGFFIKLGIIFFSAAVLFYIITLPVEFNASRRAIAILGGEYYLDENELKGAKKVLGAAALTYVAAALTAVLELVRMLMLARGDD